MIIDEILDIMDEILDSGKAVPLNVKKIIIEGERMRDCINDVRLNLPTEIRDAKNIVLDRKTIIADAHREADQIVKRAEDRARAIVSSDEITKAARAKAAEILGQANSKSKEIKHDAKKYIEDILTQTEERLQSGLIDIKKTRQAVKNHR